MMKVGKEAGKSDSLLRSKERGERCIRERGVNVTRNERDLYRIGATNTAGT